MKEQILSIIVLIFFQISATSQPCLPEGITFETQAQIDSFQINHPNCTEIEGDVYISGGDITNLNGLSVLTSIGGSVGISMNYALTSLTGLEGLTTVGNDLAFGDNPSLTSLSGLENVTSIGNQLSFFWNNSLTSLTGLENVTSIGGSVSIKDNNNLTSFSGLEGLNSIGGSVSIKDNNNLTSLSGLEGLNSIGNDLTIEYNPSLTSLSGLDNVNPNSINNLSIGGNPLLSACNVQSICDYLASPNGIVNIFDNAMGCNSPPEIANDCGITLPCLPYGDYYFISQNDIDNFVVNYPNCTVLEGGVVISGDDITNLNGLSVLTSIGNGLWIIINSALTSLTGLDNLTTIGGSLVIGYNDALTSLTGLDNIETDTIEELDIGGNPYLSHCSVLSICNYLGNPNGDVLIYNNAPGCNSEEEVEEACEDFSIEEQFTEDYLSLYPNPAHQELNISVKGYSIDRVTVYTLTGQQVMSKRSVDGAIDISHLQPGMYIIEVMVENTKLRQKLLVQR